MGVSELLKASCISFDVSLNSKDEVFEYLINQLYEAGAIGSKATFLEAVKYRETLSETGLGEGIAIPHGKSDAVLHAAIAFVRLKEAILWESLDDKPVQYVFLLAIPNSGDDQHIRIISQLARSLIKEPVIAAIKNADNPETLLEALKED